MPHGFYSLILYIIKGKQLNTTEYTSHHAFDNNNQSYTWSAHQYQIDATDWPNKKPGHGISDDDGSRSITQESGLGRPQVLFGLDSVVFGMACMYL